jgi:hypothetical protein
MKPDRDCRSENGNGGDAISGAVPDDESARTEKNANVSAQPVNP